MQSSVPLTYNRARTAIVQSRSHLLKARTEMRLAVEILEWLDDPQVPWPADRSERQELLRVLRLLLARIERTEQTLTWAWRPPDGHAPSAVAPSTPPGAHGSRLGGPGPMHTETVEGTHTGPDEGRSDP
jgi:hypothetical protein